ncbi:MAG: hypothetical protein WBO66_05170 [Candidatus Moraniibacteriota bacterium]
MKIGFSTGSLYRTHDRISPQTFDIFRKVGCTALEILWHPLEDIEKIERLSREDFQGFKYISIHLPLLDESKKDLLSRIEKVHERLHFDAAILHPDEVKDWTFFKNTPLPLTIENMDARKAKCKNAADLQEVFQSIDINMTLDVAHAFDNDPSMQLGKELATTFQQRINEIHVSGYNYRDLHDPIHLSKQTQILDAIPSINLPIIIESVCLTVDEVQKEFDYISTYLQRNQLRITE